MIPCWPYGLACNAVLPIPAYTMVFSHRFGSVHGTTSVTITVPQYIGTRGTCEGRLGREDDEEKSCQDCRELRMSAMRDSASWPAQMPWIGGAEFADTCADLARQVPDQAGYLRPETVLAVPFDNLWSVEAHPVMQRVSEALTRETHGVKCRSHTTGNDVVTWRKSRIVAEGAICFRAQTPLLRADLQGRAGACETAGGIRLAGRSKGLDRGDGYEQCAQPTQLRHLSFRRKASQGSP